MRMVPTAAKALAGIALVPGLLAAQADESAKYFNDSWFWGIHGGAMLFTAGADQDVKVTAPTVGGEWLITRTRIALRLSVQQAFFDEQTAVFDPTVAGAARPVDVSDWRRYAAEIYFVPKVFGMLRPYGGLGIALNVLQNATPSGSFTSEESLEEVFTQVDESSSRASAVFTAGLQAGIGRSALFVQGSAMPTRNNFLFARSAYTFVVEAGLRYNFASAIEKF
jgi:hypothetical protein